MTSRTAELLTEYGRAKFGDRWDPPDDASPEEISSYGEAGFGDEYWPGSPWSWIGRERGDELCRLLGCETSDQVNPREWEE